MEIPKVSLRKLFEKYKNQQKGLSQKRMTDMLYQTVFGYAHLDANLKQWYEVSDETIFVDRNCEFKLGFNIWN